MGAIFGAVHKFSQRDGTEVQLRVFGDEFYARSETLDGYTVVFDDELGGYCYALLLEGQFISSRAPVAKPAPPGLVKHLKESAKVRKSRFDERYNLLRLRPQVESTGVTRTFGPNRGLLAGRQVNTGKIRGLTILVEFADLTTDIQAGEVDAMLNSANYSANNNICSVRDYFLQMSSGKLDYTNRVVGPIRLSKNLSYYRQHLLVAEVMNSVVNEHGINLEEFDSREEGIVDAINIMYAGRSQTDADNMLWPHNSSITLRYGSMRTHYYMLTSLGRSRVDLSIGTFCHENGHQLCRFPDLYDYGSRDDDSKDSYGIGVFCLMGNGNHLNNGRAPSPICAYLRDLAGWCDNTVTINGPGIYQARQGDYATLLKYETGRMNEYFLVENRSRMGLDAYQMSSGLAVYHCDTLGSNEWQDMEEVEHYQCALLQADGLTELEHNLSYGDWDDLFPQKEGICLDYHTNPSSRNWDGSDSGLAISDISAPGEIISFRIGNAGAQTTVAQGALSPDLLIPDNQPEGVSSTIMLAERGKAKALEVTVDIIHTYVGDLELELEAPSGQKALLKKKSSDSSDDLKVTYTSAFLQTLATLVGESVSGPWRLHIRDLARRDTGRLNFWQLRLPYESMVTAITKTAEVELPIPDNDTAGTTSVIEVSEGGKVAGIEVEVDIRHTYIGDLVVEVISPGGQSAVLHNRTGVGTKNLLKTYGMENIASLQGLVGQEVHGSWSLRVRDLAPQDIGILNGWKLKLEY